MLGVEDVSVLGVEDISALRVDSALEDSLGVGKGEDPALGDGKALEASVLGNGSALEASALEASVLGDGSALEASAAYERMAQRCRVIGGEDEVI